MLTKSVIQYNLQISQTISEKIDDFVQRIATFTRDRLIAVYAYGAITQEDFDVQSSYLQIMLVFKEVNTDLLEILAPASTRANEDFRLDLKIIGETDLQPSSDVFPIEFTNIKETRFLLYGEDVFKKVSVTFEDLRRACERETKQYLFQLRSYFALHTKRPEELIQKITGEFEQFLLILNAALLLKTGDFASNASLIIEQASEEFNLDEKVLNKIRNIHLGRERVSDMIDILHIYNKYLYLIIKISRIIDRFDIYK
ncbi:MAG: hypothetical protein ACFB0B_05510 [Thermonemataceae bacterium]